MNHFWQKEINMFLKFEEDKKVACCNDQEPEKQGGKYVERGEQYLNEHVLTLCIYVFLELRLRAPDKYLQDNKHTKENQCGY